MDGPARCERDPQPRAECEASTPQISSHEAVTNTRHPLSRVGSPHEDVDPILGPLWLLPPPRSSERMINQPAFRLSTALALTALVSACTSTPRKHYDESLIRGQIHGADSAPEWVKGVIQTDPSMLSFVGRGIAFNVLDERKAYDEAVMHAREQLAQYVRTEVISEACDKDWADGARFIPSEKLEFGGTAESSAYLSFRAGQMAEAVVGQLLPTAQHWEQWELDDPVEPHKVTRYKCWVLAEVPADRVDGMVNATLALLEKEANESVPEPLEVEEEVVVQIDDSSVELAAALAREAELAGMVNANIEELMHLRERVMYGRAFRLTTKDNCPTPDPCQPLARPDWRKAQVEVLARVETIVVPQEPVAVEVEVEKDLTPCERLASRRR